MIVVPHEWPRRLTVSRFLRFLMKSTAVFTSLVACGSRTTGGLLSGGWSIAGGRVERP